MPNTNTLAICQLFNPVLHGDCDYDQKQNPNGHYLAIYSYDEEFDETPSDFLGFWNPCNLEEKLLLNQSIDDERRNMMNKLCQTSNHNNIANLKELNNVRFPKVDIVNLITLNSGHTIAIKKTFWLSIFQRLLKKRYSTNRLLKKQRVAYTH
jgi:hypothetical protein